VLGINSDPVTIKQVEVEIIHRAFASGWVVPLHPSSQSGRRVAVIGSGPATLAAAQQLTRAGQSSRPAPAPGKPLAPPLAPETGI
jgi:glutamate synthase (NADPH) small chain